MVSADALDSGIDTKFNIRFPTFEVNHFQIAKNQAFELSRKLLDGFQRVAKGVAVLPPFNKAAKINYYISTDKFAKAGKEGQALFDKPGMQYGGSNLIVGMIRRLRAAIRATESKTYKLAPV